MTSTNNQTGKYIDLENDPEHEYPSQPTRQNSVKYHPDENESSNNEVSHESMKSSRFSIRDLCQHFNADICDGYDSNFSSIESREFADSEDSSRFSIRDLCQHYGGDICDGYKSNYDLSDHEFSLGDKTQRNDDSFFNWCDTASEPELMY